MKYNCILYYRRFVYSYKTYIKYLRSCVLFKPFMLFWVLPIFFTGCKQNPAGEYTVSAPGLTVHLSDGGQITGLFFERTVSVRAVQGSTRLADCHVEGKVSLKKRKDGGLEFKRTWVSDQTGKRCRVTDRFLAGEESVRWEMEIQGDGDPWSTPVETHWTYPDSGSARFWTAWGDPRLGTIRGYSTQQQAALGILPDDISGNWSDPLVPIPFVDDTLWYGAPYYTYDNPRLAFCPFQGNLIGIPLLTVLENPQDMGVSLVLSPDDQMLDMVLHTQRNGRFVFSRMFHRISGKAPVRFTMDIVEHEGDWRGGLRWMTHHYPEYFDPNLPHSSNIAGTGAYSSHGTDFDVAKMKKMAFRVNWKASFDFPYMGMFIPPVAGDTMKWLRYGGGMVSIAGLRDYATRMKDMGFFVLSYFNVTEFGANVLDPAPPKKALNNSDLWRDPNDFLYSRLADAILKVPPEVKPEKLRIYPRSRVNGPYFTWGEGIVLDPGEPVYQDFLMEQARRHIDKLPDAAGICIDRMDWLRMYNEKRDDGISWYGDKPSRSLLWSWRDLMSKLGPLMHDAGKVIFVNNHDKRIDLLRHTDGFFDEFTYGGSPLNTTALMGINRPVMGWTGNEDQLKPDPDAFFQRFLYMGVYPMAPFPGNDHSLSPGKWVDRYYLDYGPLLDAMRGKKWVLESHCIEVKDAKVNLFGVPGGWVIPVTFGPSQGTVTINLHNVQGISERVKVDVLHPGLQETVNITPVKKNSGIELTIPTRRGCAMVRIQKS